MRGGKTLAVTHWQEAVSGPQLFPCGKGHTRDANVAGKLKESSLIATGCPSQTWWCSCLLPYPSFPGHLETTVFLYIYAFPSQWDEGTETAKLKLLLNLGFLKAVVKTQVLLAIDTCAIYSLCVRVIKCLSSQSNNGYQNLSTFLRWSCELMTPEPLTSRRFQSDYLKGCLEAW